MDESASRAWKSLVEFDGGYNLREIHEFSAYLLNSFEDLSIVVKNGVFIIGCG